jgi:hypothetical protein
LVTVGGALHRLDHQRITALATQWRQATGHIATQPSAHFEETVSFTYDLAVER